MMHTAYWTPVAFLLWVAFAIWLGRRLRGSTVGSWPVGFTKSAVASIWAIAVASLLYGGYLYLDYGARMPPVPELATGRVNPFDFKGRTVYVTEAEESRYRTMQLVSVLSWAAFVLAAITWGRPSAARPA